MHKLSPQLLNPTLYDERIIICMYRKLLWRNTQLPLATLAVNVVGSFLIGLLSAMALSNNISPATKLLLITGFCGGFTTFSTFMNENLLLARGGQLAWAIAYTVASISLGIIALIAGYKVGS